MPQEPGQGHHVHAPTQAVDGEGMAQAVGTDAFSHATAVGGPAQSPVHGGHQHRLVSVSRMPLEEDAPRLKGLAVGAQDGAERRFTADQAAIATFPTPDAE
jgi:hypothetical protein